MRLSVIPGAALLLSACNAVIVDSYPSIPINYAEGDFDQATTKGAIVTTIVGTPFSSRNSNFADHVRGLMKNQVGDLPVEFVASEGAGATKPFKVVVVFNPRDNASYASICQKVEQTPQTAGGQGQASVAMVFCEGDRLKSGTSGRITGAKSPNDPKFIALVQQVANTLIPPSGLEKQLQNGK
jgi:hypothetical protein